MTDDTQARRLHDKAGLAAWYARQDQEEAALLASSSQASPALDSLRQEVEAALGGLQALT